jgi:glycosyltransferase involved in cell wall biosynthesis
MGKTYPTCKKRKVESGGFFFLRILRTFTGSYPVQNNILILTYWSFPDALIQTYTLPYVRIIRENLSSDSSIFLLTLEKNYSTLSLEKKNEIKDSLQKEGITWLPFPYKAFGISAFFMWIKVGAQLAKLIISNRIATIHSWCTPAGAIGYLLANALNRKLILDSFEPHAESMVENGTWRRESLAFKLLFWLEKKQTQKATYIISATEGMREYAKRKYNVDIENFFVKPACVDLDLFSNDVLNDQQLRRQLGLENKIVCVYAGKFGGIYLEDDIFDFINIAASHWGEAFRFLILTNHSREEIAAYCNRANVKLDCIVMKFVPHNEVPRYMGLADFAITPVKPIPTKRYCTPIKDGEYWALGLPIVISKNISDDSDIIETNNIGVVLNTFSREAYQDAVLKIDVLRKQSDLRERIQSIAKKYRSFDIAEKVYREVYGNKSK